MEYRHDLVKMFLAGVDWERRRGDKPAIGTAIMDAIRQTRDAEQRNAPAEAGGESCMCEKPLDDDGWRCIRCGRLLSPRLGG
jgi:hypothetical protein